MTSRCLTVALLLHVVAGVELYAHMRKDMWKNHPEMGVPDPKDGRRIHIVVDGVSVEEKNLGSVTVNGKHGLPIENKIDNFDWFRAHSNPSTKQVWLSFHTRNTDLGDASSLKVKISKTDGTVLVDDSVKVTQAGVSLTYVTTRSGGKQAILHLHGGEKTDQVAKVIFDGKEVSLPKAASSMPSNGHMVLTVDNVNKKAGDIWTAVIFSGSGTVGYGGRTIPERFVIEAWPTSDDCSLPGINDDNAEQLKDLGIDSVYFEASKMTKHCGASSKDDFSPIVEKLATVDDGWFHLFATGEHSDATGDLDRLSAKARARVDAALVGDEVDDKTEYDNFRAKFNQTIQLMTKYPEIPVYQGSKTLRNVGAFCGLTDIQGSDAYNAACAPTMSPAVSPLGIDYPYLYLRNARDNHAPLTFWGYSQLTSEAWSYQPNPAEITMQLGQLLLSGSKSIMFFQSNAERLAKIDTSPVKQALFGIRQVSEIIRTGDIGGVDLSVSNSNAMAEAILTPEKLLLVVVNTNAHGYSNLLCHTEILARHWTFSKNTVRSVSLDTSSAPGVGKLTNWQEATDKGLAPLSDASVSGETGMVKLSNIKLDNKLTFRIFVADVQPASEATQLMV